MIQRLFSFKGRSNRIDYAINMLAYLGMLAAFLLPSPPFTPMATQER